MEVKTGTFTFQVSVNGTISRTDVTIDAQAEWVKYMAQIGTRQRRAVTSTAIVVAVPQILFPDEWQLVLVWNRNTLAAQDDFNSHLVTPYSSCTQVNPITTTLCDDTVVGRTTEFFPSNYRNSVNGAGPETISFYGTQRGTYRHFVYGAASLASYVNSNVQVNLYNIKGLVASLHVTADGATSLATSTKHRFWHTFS